MAEFWFRFRDVAMGNSEQVNNSSNTAPPPGNTQDDPPRNVTGMGLNPNSILPSRTPPRDDNDEDEVEDEHLQTTAYNQLVAYRRPATPQPDPILNFSLVPFHGPHLSHNQESDPMETDQESGPIPNSNAPPVITYQFTDQDPPDLDLSDLGPVGQHAAIPLDPITIEWLGQPFIDPNNSGIPGSVANPVWEIHRLAHNATIQAQEDLARQVGPRVPISKWRNPFREVPRIPFLAQRSHQATAKRIGYLKHNLRVKSTDANGRETWNANPTDEEADRGRKRGDPVYLKLKEHGTWSPSFIFCDSWGVFVPVEAIQKLAAVEGREVECQHEVARLFFLELMSRILAWERDIEIFLKRCKLFVAWAPPASANISGHQTREERRQMILDKLSAAQFHYQEWNNNLLRAGFRQRAHVYRGELARHAQRLITHSYTSVDELLGEAHNPARLPYRDSDVFKSDADTAERARAALIAAKYGPATEDAVTACLMAGKYGRKLVRGKVLMELCLARGWSKAELIQHHPRYVLLSKTIFW